MRNEIQLFTMLELRSLYGWNKFRYTKDKKAKNRYRLLLSVWMLVIAMVASYVGALTYGLSSLGLSNIVPSYLVMIASLLILAFGIFKTGATIFSKKGYDFLCSLPVRQSSIVISRFLLMYVEDFLLTLAVLLPGILVYGFCVRPNISFYLWVLLSVGFIPMIPLVIATLIGVIFTAIASHMKHKSFIETVLMVTLVVVILLASFQSESFAETISPEMLTEFADIIANMIAKIYPPAVWFGNAVVSGNISNFVLFIAFSIVSAMLLIAIVSQNFHKICRRLFATPATHNYKMENLKSQGMLAALYQREWKRYFSSTIYVTNTIIGPILAAIMSVALLITGPETLINNVPIPLDMTSLIPLAVGGVFCMMTTTSTSISMEGKQFWIIKTLPIPTKWILDAKILLNLSLILPFYIVSAICLVIALKPSMWDMLWIILSPALLILFSVVCGITVNLKLHNFDWEKEEAIVKQSASAMLGGFVGVLVAGICAVLLMIAPTTIVVFVKVGICILLFVLTLLLYCANNKVKLELL